MNMIAAHEHAALLAGRHPQGAEYGGPPRRALATGRARCRRCGSKIERGAEAIRWVHDYQGSGSWTAIDSYVHAFDCGR